ncbi:DUF3040 domain-containing protein [Bounagaea algeriensis]
MFHRREQRQLAKIERQLSSDDPDFARRMTNPRLITRVMHWMTVWRALGVLAGMFAVLSLLLGTGTGFLLASVLAAVLLTYARWQAHDERSRGTGERSRLRP